jgi:hypothetical protein
MVLVLVVITIIIVVPISTQTKALSNMTGLVLVSFGNMRYNLSIPAIPQE